MFVRKTAFCYLATLLSFGIAASARSQEADPAAPIKARVREEVKIEAQRSELPFVINGPNDRVPSNVVVAVVNSKTGNSIYAGIEVHRGATFEQYVNFLYTRFSKTPGMTIIVDPQISRNRDIAMMVVVYTASDGKKYRSVSTLMKVNQDVTIFIATNEHQANTEVFPVYQNIVNRLYHMINRSK